MKFIETLFWGIIIACTSLIVQVLITVIAELFFRITITFQYLPNDSFRHLVTIMFLAAFIEEFLRFIVIKKRILFHKTNYFSIIILGILLGTGFASFELSLALFNHMSSLTFFTVSPIFAVHISLSIFLLLFLKSNDYTSRDILSLIASIIFHVIGNFSILYFLM